MKTYWVYILANRFGSVLYVGMTGSIERRLWEHRTKALRGFTSRYNVDRLVHLEQFTNVEDAIAREKMLKGWRRSKKVALIVAHNPKWTDFAEEWDSSLRSECRQRSLHQYKEEEG